MKKITRIVMTFALALIMLANSAFAITAKAAVVDPAEPAEARTTIEVEKVTFDSVPLYDQTDFPHIPYSQGSIYTSGCGITCMAMVASYILDEPVSPATLGLEYNKSATDNVTRMLNAADGLGIKYEKPENWNEMKEELEAGKVAIILVNKNSIFTNYGHFIVLTGITEDGKFMVNDPWGPNYKLYPNEFENGFEEWQILQGYSGGWTFEK